MKIKRMCCLAMAAVMACGMVSCGADKPKGLYYSISASIRPQDYADDLDDELKENADNNADYYSIEFDGDEAEIYINEGAYKSTYLAEYEIDEKTGQFTFDYQSLKRESENGTIKIKPGDKDGDRTERVLSESLENMSDTGGMPRYSVPWITGCDTIADFSFLPKYIVGGNVRSLIDDVPAALYKKGDVLCTDVYGLELDGKYKPGKKFTLEFDQYQVYKDCPLIDMDKERMERCKEIILQHYNSKKTDSTIEFDDGEWTWYNHEGDVLNDGEYVESEDYEGLIGMYITDKSARNYYNGLYNKNPLFLYLADDGEIYFPVFVKEK